jgi:hypothetical protein
VLDSLGRPRNSSQLLSEGSAARIPAEMVLVTDIDEWSPEPCGICSEFVICRNYHHSISNEPSQQIIKKLIDKYIVEDMSPEGPWGPF